MYRFCKYTLITTTLIKVNQDLIKVNEKLEDEMSFDKELSKYIIRGGFNNASLAKMIHTSPQNIGYWRGGTYTPSERKHLIRLACTFKLTQKEANDFLEAANEDAKKKHKHMHRDDFRSVTKIENLYLFVCRYFKSFKLTMEVAIAILISGAVTGILILGLVLLLIFQQFSCCSLSENINLTISSPKNGQSCPHTVYLTGTVKNLPEGKQLWVVKKLNGSYHPDDSVSVENNNWRGVAYIGNRDKGADTGMEFTVLIVLANSEAVIEFRHYLKNAQKLKWAGMPDLYGAEQVGEEITLIRNDAMKQCG